MSQDIFLFGPTGPARLPRRIRGSRRKRNSAVLTGRQTTSWQTLQLERMQEADANSPTAAAAAPPPPNQSTKNPLPFSPLIKPNPSGPLSCSPCLFLVVGASSAPLGRRGRTSIPMAVSLPPPLPSPPVPQFSLWSCSVRGCSNPCCVPLHVGTWFLNLDLLLDGPCDGWGLSVVAEWWARFSFVGIRNC